MALRLKRGGFALLATVCSTWVFINRATSGRSIWNPLGRRGVKCVEDANVTLPKPYRFSLLVGVKLFCTVGVCNLIPIYFVHNAVGMPQKSLIAGQNQHLGHRQYQGVFPSTISRKYV